jgi:uncharacterized membrane protein
LSIILAPLVGVSWIYEFFSRICHQDPARSWQVWGKPLAVCIRCTSIYFAFTVSLWLGLRANQRWLRISFLVMICEVVIARTLFDAAVLRSISGVLLGLSAAPFVKKGIEELIDPM